MEESLLDGSQVEAELGVTIENIKSREINMFDDL
jgi:hypothetical protein